MGGGTDDRSAVAVGHAWSAADRDAIIAGVSIGFHVYDVASGVVRWDAQTRAYWGVGDDVEIDFDLWANSLHPDDREATKALVAAALDPDGSHRYAACYRITDARDGHERLIEANGYVEFDGRQPVRLCGTVQEVRAAPLAATLGEVRAEAIGRSAQIDALYDAVPTGIALFDTEFRFERVNRTLAHINGLPAQDHIGRSIEDVLPGPTAATLRSIQPMLLQGEEVAGLEIDGVDPVTGEVGSALVSYRPVFDARRHVTGFVGTITDISDRKRAEEREKLLAREVDHRARNLLMVIQSVATMTRADTIAAYRAAITARIGALGRAHSLLAHGRWTGVDLRQLALEELRPHCGERLERCAIAGPDVELTPAAAQSLAMVIHELATNAAKYGALCRPEGMVSLSWALGADDRVEFAWAESGGPPVRAPRRQGFGTRLIDTSIAALNGSAAKHWTEQGLRLCFSVPLAAIGTLARAGNDDIAGAAPPAMATPAAPQPAIGTRSILVVEDEAIVGLDLADMLGDAGHRVLGPAATVRESLALIDGEPALDLALIDVNLDGESSAAVAAALRRRAIPFALCTGYHSPESFAPELGGAPILAKPYCREDVLAMVARLVSA